MQLVCPACGNQLPVAGALEGRPLKCPNCGAAIPAPQSAPPTRSSDTPESSRDRAEASSNQERLRRQERGDAEQPHTTNRGVGVILAIVGFLVLICCIGVVYGLYWLLNQPRQ